MSIIGLLFVASLVQAFPGVLITRQSSLLPIYDYIIVGGGTSGLVVANRLSEKPKTTVLVIEAGPFITGEAEFWDILVPGAPGQAASRASKYFWQNVTSEPDTVLNGRIHDVSAARIAGGASALNGMVWGRLGKRDHQDWAEYLDDSGWGWEGMLKYYKRVETFTPPLPEYQKKGNVTWDWSYHGRDGPIRASYPQYFYESNRALMGAEKALNIPHKRDQGSGDNVGAIWVPNSIRSREYVRSYSKTEYYEAYKGERKNLHLLTENTVTRVLFDGKTAVGVEYAKSPAETKSVVKAKKEVVMAAGTIKGAPLLQVSGLGDKKLLKQLGVPVVADLPLIGEGFQDHAWIRVVYNYTFNQDEARWSAGDETFIEEQRQIYLHDRTGLFTSSFKNRMMLLPLPFLLPEDYRSLLSRYSKSSSLDNEYLRDGIPPSYIKLYKLQKEILLKSFSRRDAPVDENIAGHMASVLRPLSRGYIHATTSSAFDRPKVDYRTLSHPLDLEILLAGIRFVRKFMSRPELAQLSPKETIPGSDKQSDEEIIRFLKERLSPSNGHACCTLGMGTVTDSRMRVIGVKRLRVVDSSAWAFAPGAHATQQTAYVVAEKAADLIKKDA